MSESHASTPKSDPVLVRWRKKNRVLFDACAMLIYLTIVHVWALGVSPLGRDFAALASNGAEMPLLARELFQLEMWLFGGFATGYHLVNMALLFAGMLLIYAIVNEVIRGPYWLGIFAATLWMANPVHGESVLNISGVSDLVPCLTALLAFWLYVRNVSHGCLRQLAVAFATFLLAALLFPMNAMLGLVCLLYEALVAGGHRRTKARPALYALGTIAAVAIHYPHLLEAGFDPASMFGPLYLVFYPIGFLPETAKLFHDAPWTGWLAGGGVAFVLGLIHWKAQRPVIVFGILAMLAFRLFQGGQPVDWVHAIGGGQLLFANALFNLGFMSLYLRMMDHPRWRPVLVSASTTLSIIFFIMQIYATTAWWHASSTVATFQRQAEEMRGQLDGKPLVVCPDYQYYRGAPLQLSDSVAHDTLFSPRLALEGILPLHYQKPSDMQVNVAWETPQRAWVRIEGARAIEAAPWPYALADADQTVTLQGGYSATLAQDSGGVVVYELTASDTFPPPEQWLGLDNSVSISIRE